MPEEPTAEPMPDAEVPKWLPDEWREVWDAQQEQNDDGSFPAWHSPQLCYALRALAAALSRLERVMSAVAGEPMKPEDYATEHDFQLWVEIAQELSAGRERLIEFVDNEEALAAALKRAENAERMLQRISTRWPGLWTAPKAIGGEESDE